MVVTVPGGMTATEALTRIVFEVSVACTVTSSADAVGGAV